jgi:hypothetical protein
MTAGGSRRAAIGRGLRSAGRYEARLWAALFAWATRRPMPAEPDTTYFSYERTVRMLFGVFIGVSAIEIPIVHLILPWQTARYLALAIGGYGLIWMVGLWVTMRRHPHAVGPAALRIRNGGTVEVTVGWDAVREIRVRRRSLPPGGQTQVDEEGEARIVSIGVASQTSVDVLLTRPLTVDVAKTAGRPVTQIRFHADDPEDLVADARRYVPTDSRTG